VLSSFAQAPCDGDLKVGEHCSIYVGTTIIEGNNNSPLMYMKYDETIPMTQEMCLIVIAFLQFQIVQIHVLNVEL